MKAFFTTILYQPLYNLLIFLAWLIPGHSIGGAIILLTIITRVILLPSSLKAARLQVKNLALQPKINKLKNEIKDQAEQSKALMELYKQEGVSPFGSCLPLLIQLPILWVLFSVFRNGLTSAGFSSLYGFVPHPETINTQFLGINLIHPNLWVLPIIAGLLQFALSWMMMPPKKDEPKDKDAPADPMALMNKQMLFLPSIITIFFGRSMPAALVLYWIATTVFGIAQQWYVNREIKNQTPNIKNDEPEVISVPVKSETNLIEAEPKKVAKQDFMTKMMSKRLDRAEKKTGVNVTVRTKKKW